MGAQPHPATGALFRTSPQHLPVLSYRSGPSPRSRKAFSRDVEGGLAKGGESWESLSVLPKGDPRRQGGLAARCCEGVSSDCEKGEGPPRARVKGMMTCKGAACGSVGAEGSLANEKVHACDRLRRVSCEAASRRKTLHQGGSNVSAPSPQPPLLHVLIHLSKTIQPSSMGQSGA